MAVSVKNTFIDVAERRPSTMEVIAPRDRCWTGPPGAMGQTVAMEAVPSIAVSSPAPMPGAATYSQQLSPTLTKGATTVRSILLPQPVPAAASPRARTKSVTITQGSPLALPMRPRMSSSFDSVHSGHHSVRKMSTEMSNRRLSFDVPVTPEAYWARSRHASFQMPAQPAVDAQSGGLPLSAPPVPADQGPPQGAAYYAPAAGHMPFVPYPYQYPTGYPTAPAPAIMTQSASPAQSIMPHNLHMMTTHPQMLQGPERTRLELGSLITASPVPPARAVPPSSMPVQGNTTVMLRNIPVKYNREMVLQDMDSRGLRGLYDFFYLPIDFQTGNTVGYAFINFVDEAATARFRAAYDGLQLSPDSAKICQVGLAKAQGKAQNVEQYRNSSVMAMEDRFQPVVFENGVKVAFPPPTRALKPVKQRVRANP